MSHVPGVLADFQNGETRLVYGRRLAVDELFLLPDGEAKELRAWTKRELRCPVRDCPSPAITTVSRTRGRDGFMHYGAGDDVGGHAPESLFHMQACERIAVWLRALYPSFTVQKEEIAGDRRADVMITAPEGSRMAFEIQYSALTPAQWQERHDSYQSMGIVDVWLFGHHGAQLRQAHAASARDNLGGNARGNVDDNVVIINPTHAAVIAAGLPLLWFNPVTAQIGTAVDQVVLGQRQFEIPAAGTRGQFTVEDLACLRLCLAGVTSDRFQLLEKNGAEMEAMRLELEGAQKLSRAEQEASRAAAQRVMMAADAVIAADKQEAIDRVLARRAAMDARALLLEPAWLTSDLHLRILDEFDGRWPGVLDVATTGEPGLPFPSQQWQATLFAQFIEGRPIFSQLSSGQSAAHLTAQGLRDVESTAIIREWFDVLVAEGYLLCVPVKKKRYSIGPSRVRYTTAIKRTPKAQRATDAKSKTLAALPSPGRSAPLPHLDTVHHHEQRSYAPASPLVVDPVRLGVALCRDCARPLAAMFVARGYHLICGPGRR
ncbi:hypothetical protein E3T46_05685 [Cryobacterium sp. Hh11]|uniref:competence protein CoiA family protein n=1 Tax=Cryobacterium sp. Hh11 TaxID=2555868 RepID=UPI00106C7CBE|nr:competence protein CoiA family protein [Cryobacterium sp. Hh11]TFD52358.1 hypothetical protein E3T46_05685 [Cryobacterium sp. Hh11]